MPYLKELKFNKKFQPVSSGIGDEMYLNGIFEFNITKLSEFINKNQDQFLIEMVEVNKIRIFPIDSPDDLIINSANLLNPIILAEISPYKFVVIDGNHRLEKAYRNNINKIPAYRVYADQHIKFFTSDKAYKEYVQYWNSKIDKESIIKLL